MHDTVSEDANVGVLVARDRLTTPHAARKHRVDRSRELLERGVVMPGGDVHDTLSYMCRELSPEPTRNMNDHLLRLIGHMRWADAQFADALDLDPVGDAVRLFAHVASVEHLWYARIQGRAHQYPVWPSFDVAQSRAVAAEHADLFEQLVMNADDNALSRRVAYRNSAGRDYQSPVDEIVTHVAMHGMHHRGQIARLLRTAGREPPYTDYIQYSRRDQ